MSLTSIRPYFRARLNALAYKEWDDAFNFDNIPEDILDKAYHIEALSVSAQSMNQTDLQVEHEVVTRLFFKGFHKPKDALDKVMERLEDIFVEILKPTNRLTGTSGLRNVLLTSAELSPIADSNDNSILVTITWRVQVNICTT